MDGDTLAVGPATAVGGEDSHVVMSERVQTLAGSIYQELERMIAKYDEGVVKTLMPLVVNILESLDLSYTENQEHEVELELLREDNEQLVTQYEREKQLRRLAEQRALELEDNTDEQQKTALSKIESLESIVRMFELKRKNTADHVSRLEDKEETMKKEYGRLHDRYNELLRSHMDYMERTKLTLGTDRLDQLQLLRGRLPQQLQQSGRSSGPVSFGYQSLEQPPARSLAAAGTVDSSTDAMSTAAGGDASGSIRDEIEDASIVLQRERNRQKARVWDREMSMDDVTPDHEDTPVDLLMSVNPATITSTTTTSEHRSANNLYQELSFNDPESLVDVDDNAEITASDNFFGMGKEVDNLIKENNELLATKNALNIVKDDLIAQVDELAGENDILREEVKCLQAVRSRLQLRIQELEDEMKRSREEAESAKKEASEDEVPMAQRKRFTRVEMARVLMERNQYKERFMELQEAVRWTEMIRASRSDSSIDRKGKQGIWKFFSNLFSSADSSPGGVGGSTPSRAGGRDLPYGDVQYDAPSGSVTPVLDTAARVGCESTPAGSQHERRRVLDFLDADISSEKVQQRLATERKEQYKKVRAYVKKDDGRMQAYGWSLPAKISTAAGGVGQSGSADDSSIPAASTSISGRPDQPRAGHVPVPVPVYCRPLMEKEPGMKIWCAAGVNMTGGRTRDGGSVVGASVFYSQQTSNESSPSSPSSFAATAQDEIEQLSQQLQLQQQVQCEGAAPEQSLSSLVWICTSTHAASKVTVIDANNPADVLESFPVCSSHLLCIASVPGAKISDYDVSEEMRLLSAEDSGSTASVGDGGVTCSDGGATCSDGGATCNDSGATCSDGAEPRIEAIRLVACATGDSGTPSRPLSSSPTDDAGIRPVLRKQVNSQHSVELAPDDNTPGGSDLRLMTSSSVDNLVRDGVGESASDGTGAGQQEELMSSVLPTMWLGSQSGCVYVHSTKSLWRRCIHSIRLRDSVLTVVHVKGRVLASLANGTVAIFHRGPDGQWDLTNYHLLDLGQPQYSIRCMTVVQEKVWCGCRNRVHVIDPKCMEVEASFDAHPRRESQVRQMTWLGDGVWISIRLDSTLRLYHAHTRQHLQDVDIEPYVSKMLAGSGIAGGGKLGYAFVRITALVISCARLWIGTGNGVIISVPLNVDGSAGGADVSPDDSGSVRVYTDPRGERVTPASFIPYCHMSQAQLSFHGHRDAVKFFVAVPGVGGLSTDVGTSSSSALTPQQRGGRTKPLLVMSGGEGYIDFRIGDVDEDAGGSMVDDIGGTGGVIGGASRQSLSRGERSHLIVWQVS